MRIIQIPLPKNFSPSMPINPFFPISEGEVSRFYASARTPEAGLTTLLQGNSSRENFFLTLAPFASLTQGITKIPASVTLAQAALESGWGEHAPGNNYFGIKGKGPAGTQVLWTREFHRGKWIRVAAKFRRYSSPLENFLDHARIISEGTYLKHAMNFTSSPEVFIRALQSGKYKYATDPAYVEKILNLINQYGLKRFDLPS